MPLATFRRFLRPPEVTHARLRIGEREVPLICVPNPRARRYIIRVKRDASVRVTVPRGGSISAALDFARRQTAWIEKQLNKPTAPTRDSDWAPGTLIYFRGELVPLIVEPPSMTVAFAGQLVAAGRGTIRARVERHLASLAADELPRRTRELAALHHVPIGRVTIRNQRTRWGSCSVRGTISLNWRLIQTPPLVSDYIVLHELMHRREMNHSARFWAWVDLVCPAWRDAEQWLKKNGRLVRG